MKKYTAKPAISKVVSQAGGAGKRTLNRIYKKNTGRSATNRSRSLKKYK